MTINNIKLQNWRNYKKFDLKFDQITILVGSNAVGKTNILEAIYYLATGKSFRTKDEYLIRWDEGFLRVEGNIEKSNAKESLLVVLEKINKIIKAVKIKGQKKPSSHLLGHLNCVIFTPEEIDLITTLPEARRRYLNLMLSQVDRDYVYALIHYKRTLEQRNRLLKRINEGLASRDELEVWDGKLAEYGSEIINKRKTYIKEINHFLTSSYELLSGNKEKLAIRYLPSVEGEWAGLVARLVQNRERDIAAKVTTSGPHRDDIEFLLENKNINEFGSRGELRSVILALKLSEVEFFEKVTGERPVLLLDDVFSELDESRRDLLSQIFRKQQTIVTTTDLDHVSENIQSLASIINLNDNS